MAGDEDDVESGRSATWREELWRLVLLAAPLIVAQVGLVAMGIVDQMVVGRTSLVTGGRDDFALTAIGLGDMYVMSVLLFGMGVSMGLDPVVTQRLGARDPRGARRALGDAMWAAVVMTPILFAAVWAIDRFVMIPVAEGREPWEALRLKEPEVGPPMRDYAWLRALGIFPFMAFAAFRSWFFARHAVWPMIAVVLLGNLLNAVLDWLFVFGDAGLVRLGLPAVGLPAFGPAGAGAVTAVVNVAMVLALWAIYRRMDAGERDDAALRPFLAEVAGLPERDRKTSEIYNELDAALTAEFRRRSPAGARVEASIDRSTGEIRCVRDGLPAKVDAAFARATSNIARRILLRRAREQGSAGAGVPAAAPPAPVASWETERRSVGVRRIYRLGIPVACQTALEVLIFNLVGVMTPGFGAATSAAHQISLRIASVTFMATTGIGAAAAVRVGRAIGRGATPEARRSGVIACLSGVVWMTACGVVLLLWPERIARIFTSDENVLAAVGPLLRIAAVFQIFDGLQSVVSGALRGAGDTLVPFLANLVAYWAIGFPIALYLRPRLGVAGMWWGLSAGLFVVSLLLTWRFLRLTRVAVARVG
ncbi:MAG TPA: MATE family efflux transporter [Planctomycetota bacterium]|nr:MATE family efflux transporter [Planctomycetota bacterium]